eukprot:GHVP01016315.1.p1 GENE.GHVP01016315.1~~GHVP01016315.1.p1  ORF type:complete len:394 (+),score=115.89 GHVP01016315.1:974-2155(+)
MERVSENIKENGLPGKQKTYTLTPEMKVLFERKSTIQQELDNVVMQLDQKRPQKIINENGIDPKIEIKNLKNQITEIHNQLQKNKEKKELLDKEEETLKTLHKSQKDPKTKTADNVRKNIEQLEMEMDKKMAQDGITAKEEKKLFGDITKMKKECKELEKNEKEKEGVVSKRTVRLQEITEEKNVIKTSNNLLFGNKNDKKAELQALTKQFEIQKEKNGMIWDQIVELKTKKEEIIKKKEEIQSLIKNQIDLEKEEREKLRAEKDRIFKLKGVQKDIRDIEKKLNLVSINDNDVLIEKAASMTEFLSKISNEKSGSSNITFPMWLLATSAELKVEIPTKKKDFPDSIKLIEQRIVELKECKGEVQKKKDKERALLLQKLEVLQEKERGLTKDE